MMSARLCQEFARPVRPPYRRTVPRVSHETRRWTGRIVLAVLLAAGLAYLPYRLLDGTGVSDAPRLRAELSETRAESERMRRENQQLARECEALRTDPTAIEDIARDDIGLVHPGEIIIRIEPPPSSVGKVRP